MAAPTAPYTTSAAVAYLLQVHLRQAADFNKRTRPTDTVADEMIGWVSAQVEMQFAAAGYVIPFAEHDDVSWPTSQTNYLGLITSLGAAAMAGGHALKPAPALAPGQGGGTGNILQDMFDKEIAKIYTVGRKPNTGTSTIRFYADTRPGTIAEQMATAPRGGTTDFMEGYYDPSRYLSFWDTADRVLMIEQSMVDLAIQWDHLYNLFSIKKGFGSSVHEPLPW